MGGDVTALREDLAEEIRELDCYTPDWAREKWDHDGVVSRLDRLHGAMLDVVEAAELMESAMGVSDEKAWTAYGKLCRALARFRAATEGEQP